MAEGGGSRHADPYADHLLHSRGKYDRYPDYEPTETGRSRGPRGEYTDRVVRRKERPATPPTPHSPIERDKAWDREKARQYDRDMGDWERQLEKDQRRDMDLRKVRAGGRDGERSRDGGQSGDRHRERDRPRQKDKDRRLRTRSRDRELEEEPEHSKDWLKKDRPSWEEEVDDDERERRARARQRVPSDPDEVFELTSNEVRGGGKELWDTRQGEGSNRKRSHTHPSKETGTALAPLWALGTFVWCAGVVLSFHGNLWWRVLLTL